MNSQCSIACRLLWLYLHFNSMASWLFCRFNCKSWSELSFLNFPRRISKDVFFFHVHVTYSGLWEREVYSYYVSKTFPSYQNSFLPAKCSSYPGFSEVEFKLRSPEVEHKYSKGCSDWILKPIAMWYMILFQGVQSINWFVVLSQMQKRIIKRSV